MEHLLSRIMQMDDRTWRRHASAWSVWTRFATLPLLVLAIWSRVWLGWWALAPIAVVALWLWWNPRAFPPPRDTDRWSAKATFGERVWLGRRETPIPRHHERAARILSLFSAIGALVIAVGLIWLHVWTTVLGAAVCTLAKLWLCDRMVWLYEDMKDARPEYRAWLTSPRTPVGSAGKPPAGDEPAR